MRFLRENRGIILIVSGLVAWLVGAVTMILGKILLGLLAFLGGFGWLWVYCVWCIYYAVQRRL